MENPVKTYTYEELQNLTKDQIKDLYNSGAYTRIAIKTADLNKFADKDAYHDADTLYIGGTGNNKPGFRFVGIDAPELAQKNMKTGEKIGEQARDKMKSVIEGSNYVYLDMVAYDHTNLRPVVKVSTDKNPDINLELLKSGYVFFNQASASSIPTQDYPKYVEAAKIAEAAKIVYSPDVMTPDEYRKYTEQKKNTGNVIKYDPVEDPSIKKDKTKVPNTEEDLTQKVEDKKQQESARKRSLAYLSRLYDHYYTSADVKVFFVGPNDKKVNVDLILGIGYDLTVSSVPVYTIGSRYPSFFTRGNSLGQGSLVFPFKNDKYLRVMLKYIFDELDVKEPYKIQDTSDLESLTDEEFTKLSQKYSEDLTKKLSKDEAIDIGAVGTLFDIEITFNNTNAFTADDSTKIIRLVGCKITSDGLETSSTRDATIQHGYKFLFKTIASGT